MYARGKLKRGGLVSRSARRVVVVVVVLVCYDQMILPELESQYSQTYYYVAIVTPARRGGFYICSVR